MSFDGMVTYAAVKEFRDKLTLGKIEKIYQPQPEQLLFNIHTKQGKQKLFISSAGNHSATYLVNETPENPPEPPVFCMVLRKHLSAARISDIVQHENDRIIEIIMETVNELGFSVNKKLIIELMGKHSNILLIDMATDKIIDSIKHVSIDVNRARQILPGKAYQYPPAQEKTPFTEITADDMQRLTSSELQPERAIMSEVQGISPALAESIAAAGNASGDPDVCDPDVCFDELRSIIYSIDAGEPSPVVYVDETGKPVDFHITPLTVYENSYDAVEFDTFSEAAAYFFSHRESSNTIKQKSNDLMRVVKAHLDKLKLKTQRLNEDLVKAENSEKYRIYGELLTANLHLAKPGSSSITVLNYYDGSQLDIPLDPKFSPSKNAQNYYKKYGKSKTAVKEKKAQLEEVGREIEYLESVVSFIDRAASIEEIDLIKQELIESGFIRFRKTRKEQKKASKPKPYSYTISSGKTVLVGRNNKENDWLTLKKASGTDMWFHTKDIPGSHAILFLEGTEPTEKDLFETAAIAAFHSKGADSENVPVDYTKVRHVKKPSGAKPGMVIFYHNRTLYVTPKLPTEPVPTRSS